MSALFGLGGLIGATISLILIIKGKIKKTSVKKAVITFLICNVFFIIGLALPSDSETGKNATAKEEIGNVKSLSFNNSDEITIKVGETLNDKYRYYLRFSANRRKTVSPDDIEFVSENPEIATIRLTEASSSRLYYEITGISAGETFVYARSIDGSVSTEKIKVIVPKPIEVESLEISVGKAEIAIGEKLSPSIVILPENAEDKNITLISSDESVATINEKNEIVACGGGTTTITASSANGVTSSVDISVDGSKYLMRVKVSHPRDDDNNIGDEWSYNIEINGERPTSTMALSPNETINFWAKFTEEDNNPDVGEASKSYTIKEEDLVNGFTITMDLYVKENGGKNSGKAAHFIVTFEFSPVG